mgnify:CR=1 FL=1
MIYQQHEILKRFISGELDHTSELEALWPQQPDASHLLVACNPQDYSASAMAKAVEDCDAQLLGLSVTGMRDSAGRPVVALTVGSASADGAARSLERYGYEVIHTRSAAEGPEHARNMERLGELLHYLEM